MDNKYTQQEFLKIMQEYNTIDRKIIKSNLKEIKRICGFENLDIVQKLDFKMNKVVGWFNYANPNIPIFLDVLTLATTFNFSIEDVIKIDQGQ